MVAGSEHQCILKSDDMIQYLVKDTMGSSSTWSRQQAKKGRTASDRNSSFGITFPLSFPGQPDHPAEQPDQLPEQLPEHPSRPPGGWPKRAPTVYDTEYSIRYADPDARTEKVRALRKRNDRSPVPAEQPVSMNEQIGVRETKFTEKVVSDLFVPVEERRRPVDTEHGMRMPKMFRSYSQPEMQRCRIRPLLTKVCKEPVVHPIRPHPEKMTHIDRRHRSDYPSDDARWIPQEGKTRFGQLPRSFDGGRAAIPFRRFTGYTTYSEDRRRAQIPGVTGGGWRAGMGERGAAKARAAFSQAAAGSPKSTLGEFESLENLPKGVQYVQMRPNEVLCDVLRSPPTLSLISGFSGESGSRESKEPVVVLPKEEPHIDPRRRNSPRLVGGTFTTNYDYNT